MQIRCPACQRLIELGDCEATVDSSDTMHSARSIASVHCPNCGLVQLPVKLDETVTFPAGRDRQRGTKIAHFLLLRFLGQGASGQVWLADDVILGRPVALKLPVSKGGETASLLHEARTAAHLRHPNIVSVYEVGRENEQAFIASEYVEGLTLRDLLSAGTPAIADTVALIVAIAKALHYAHEQGIVHRDVKPGNIILDAEGQPFVTDFGLAKEISKDEALAYEGQVLGTARYMAPEQAGGKTRETDRRADVYAIGVILFEMLTGHPPFRGNVRALLHQKMNEDPPSPRKLTHTLPRDLETICLKCLEREPSKRYPSAEEVAEELERFRVGKPIKARPISSVERAWRWCRRRPAVAGLLAGLIVSLSAGLIGVTFFYWQAAMSSELTRRSLYRSQMNLVAEFLAKGDVTGVNHTLDRVASDDQLADLRGFEWRYYAALTAPFVQVVNQGDAVKDVAVSGDGDLFASFDKDGNVYVWDGRTGERIRTLSSGSGRIRTIAFSAASGHLASGSSDGMIRLWDPAKDDRPIGQTKHGPPVAIVRFSPSGKTLLSCGTSGAVRVWDATAESLLAEIPVGRSGAKHVRFSPDGKRIAVAAQDGRVRVWDVGSQTIVAELTPNPSIESMAFSDDGQMIATGSRGGSIRVWSVSEATLLRARDTILGWIVDVEFLNGTQILAVLASDGRLHLYDAEELREIHSRKTHNLADGVLARSDNGKFLAIGSGDGNVKLLRVRGLTRRSVFWHEAHVRGLAFLPGGRRLVAASGDGALRIWDIQSGKSQRLADATGQEIRAISAQPGGNLIAAAGAAPCVALWEGRSGKLVHEIDVPEGGVAAVAFSSSGRQLAVATRLGRSYLYESGEWAKPRLAIPKREAAVQALAFSPDDRDVVIAYDDGEILFFDAAKGTRRDRSAHAATIPVALACCESGHLLAIGTDTGEIYLYDVAAGRMRSIIKAHSSRINALATLPGGTTLVSGGRDRELRLWDTASGELLTRLLGHRRQIFSIAVSPDGETIASGGLEGDLRIWRTRPME